MANSAKGAGNILGPLFIVAALAVVAIAITFAFSEEEVPDEATIIAEDGVDARPAGAGTNPEGEQDPETAGITDELDEVEPAAPDEDSVPAAQAVDDSGGSSDDGATSSDDASNAPSDGGDEAGDTASGEDTSSESDTSSEDNAASDDSAASEDNAATNDPIVEDGSGDGQAGDGVDDASVEGVPAGTDTQTELSPEGGQAVVEDSDDGGTAFVPTPSGPEGRDDETIAD